MRVYRVELSGSRPNRHLQMLPNPFTATSILSFPLQAAVFLPQGLRFLSQPVHPSNELQVRRPASFVRTLSTRQLVDASRKIIDNRGLLVEGRRQPYDIRGLLRQFGRQFLNLRFPAAIGGARVRAARLT